jgi:hypothetical protein
MRIAAIAVVLLRIPGKGRRHVPRKETRLTAQQAGSKSPAPASANRRAGVDHSPTGLARANAAEAPPFNHPQSLLLARSGGLRQCNRTLVTGAKQTFG